MGLLDFLWGQQEQQEMPPGMINVRGVPMRPMAPTSYNPLGGMLDGFLAARARNQAQPQGNFDPLGLGSMSMPGMGGGVSTDPELVAEASGIRPGGWVGAPSPLPSGTPAFPEPMGLGMPQAQPRFNPAQSGMEERGGPVQPDGQRVPLPRPRPMDMEMSSRGVPQAPAGEPMSLAPPAPGPAAAAPGAPVGMGGAPQENGFLKSISDNTPLLLALAGGFAGAPSIGTGMRRAFSNAAPVAAASQKRKEELATTASQRDEVYRALIAKGVPPADALAAARNPTILKEVADKYYGVGKDPKPPTIQEFTTPEGGKVKRQWDSTTGGWRDIPNTGVETTDKRKALSVTDLGKLSDEATNLKAIGRYATGFKDEYAGDISDTVGGIKNQYGDRAPFASKNAQERSAWWRDYQAYRNEVRHGLYGSALTKGETESFLAQDITSGMRPDQVRKVLNRQQEIVTNAIKRKGAALIEGGAPKSQVAKIYGVEPSFFDGGAATTKGGSGTVTVGGKALSWKVEDDEE